MDWQEQRKEIRRLEKKMRKENKMLDQRFGLGAVNGDPAKLKSNLKSILPPHMVPGNVGGLNKVAWPFWFQVNFDLGTNPTYSPATRQTQSFQVTNEAAFLLMAISRKSYAYSTSGELSPLQIEIRDRQSSRQFNDRPIPIQMIGIKSRPSILPTPLLMMPNAFIDVTMSSWLQGSQVTAGSGKFQFSFFGYRVRVEDADKVLSTIFG
jgi:hypothetical protein